MHNTTSRTMQGSRGFRQTAMAGVSIMAITLLLAACGGGGGNPGTCKGSDAVCSGGGSGGGGSTGGGDTSTSGATPIPTDPTLLPTASSAANVCTPEGEKLFARAYLNENYLWYNEVPAVDSTRYSTPASYFYSLLVSTPDSQGLPKDRFSFVASLADANTIATGTNYGYGVRWAADTQGRYRVAYVTAGSPAAAAGLARGGELVQVVSSNADSWSPNVAGATITFSYRPTPSDIARNITLTTAAVQDNPVPLVTTLASSGGRKVGYLLFNAHITGAQDLLITAVSQLKAQVVDDLVLDVRYNGGGFLYTALSMASMVASPASEGKVFEQLQYNDKRNAETAESVYRFSGKVQYGESRYPAGTALPQLALPRLYVLTSGNTCSASEAIVNGLRGLDVQVVLVGQTTCGKPYGFTRRDNCGLAYYPIEFRGLNAKQFGDYSAGFAASCTVADDFDHALGTSGESQLAAALYHADRGSCPASAAAKPAVVASPAALRERAQALLQPDPGATPQVPGRIVLPRHP